MQLFYILSGFRVDQPRLMQSCDPLGNDEGDQLELQIEMLEVEHEEYLSQRPLSNS